jgi:hypothetical protein
MQAAKLADNHYTLYAGTIYWVTKRGKNVPKNREVEKYVNNSLY